MWSWEKCILPPQKFAQAIPESWTQAHGPPIRSRREARKQSGPDDAAADTESEAEDAAADQTVSMESEWNKKPVNQWNKKKRVRDPVTMVCGPPEAE